MTPQVLGKVLDSLFPRYGTDCATEDLEGMEWSEDWAITPQGTCRAIRGRIVKNTAPGPDGIKAIALRKIPECATDSIGRCFNACLKEDTFPATWKKAKLALIPKGPENEARRSLPNAKPICLLNEIRKTFERIIIERMDAWMSKNPYAALTENQYGFRKDKSTCDALVKVRSEIQRVVEEGGVAIAVSLDIANAFNSLPWPKIREALRDKGFPPYIRRIISGYLTNRWVEFVVSDGRIKERAVQTGVPQGSVLGPLLWNTTYDKVLRVQAMEGCTVVRYADDTIIIATVNDAEQARLHANLQTALVVNRIKALGLKVAANKTKVVLFHGPKRRPTEMPIIRVEDAFVPATNKMKYLGIILDSRWTFRCHIDYVADKASKVARAVGRLMPNLRGPQESKRKLYATVVLSVILYGAPPWSEAVTSRATA